MASKTWTFRLEDGNHTVQLEHSYWSGKRVVLLDGYPVVRETKFMDFGSDYEFYINAHKALVKIRSTGFSFNYDLAIDGKSVTSGQPLAPAESLPRWAWGFIVACMLIPVVSLGGAVPAVIGAGGAYVCVQTARDPGREMKGRMSVCLGVTILCWLIFIVFISILADLVTRS